MASLYVHRRMDRYKTTITKLRWLVTNQTSVVDCDFGPRKPQVDITRSPLNSNRKWNVQSTFTGPASQMRPYTSKPGLETSSDELPCACVIITLMPTTVQNYSLIMPAKYAENNVPDNNISCNVVYLFNHHAIVTIARCAFRLLTTPAVQSMWYSISFVGASLTIPLYDDASYQLFVG